LQNNPVQTEN